nr:MAG TPA_asm: hypothetical protein [Caudoviricetes sp.]
MLRSWLETRNSADLKERPAQTSPFIFLFANKTRPITKGYGSIRCRA